MNTPRRPPESYHLIQFRLQEKNRTKEFRDAGKSCANCVHYQPVKSVCKRKENKPIKQYNICQHHL